MLDEEALRAPTEIEAELLHAREPGRITDLPEAATAQEMLGVFDSAAVLVNVITRIFLHDGVEEEAR